MEKNIFDTFEIHLTDKCHVNCKHCYSFKTHPDMDTETLHNTMEFVSEMANNSTSENITVLFTGGEIGMYDIDTLIKEIKFLKQKTCNIDLEVVCQTSLLYDLTEKHLELFKLVDLVGTSWDYAYRFKKISDEVRLFNNINKVRTVNDNINLIICLSDELVKNVTPKMLISFMIASGIKQFDLNRMFTPLSSHSKYVQNVSVKNEVIREYMYQAFKIYEEMIETSDTDIQVFDFECIKDAYNGYHHSAYSNDCGAHQMNISPAGDIGMCMMEDKQNSYGNVNTKIIDYDKFNKQLKDIKKLKEECKTCKYLRFCLGSCPFMYVDDTGCSCPQKAFDYLKTREGILKLNEK